jgi:hypothetical protein
VHARLQAGYGVQSSSLPLRADCEGWQCRLRGLAAGANGLATGGALGICAAQRHSLRRVAVWQHLGSPRGCAGTTTRPMVRGGLRERRSGAHSVARCVAGCELRAPDHHQHGAARMERHGGGRRAGWPSLCPLVDSLSQASSVSVVVARARDAPCSGLDDGSSQQFATRDPRTHRRR